MDSDTLVAGYLAAWNEPDPAARERLLEQVWEPDGRYTDPVHHLEGRAALSAYIGRILDENPGIPILLVGPVDHHHSHVRFYWRMPLAQGPELHGMDYGEVSAEGRLARIVGFFQPAGAAPPGQEDR